MRWAGGDQSSAQMLKNAAHMQSKLVSQTLPWVSLLSDATEGLVTLTTVWLYAVYHLGAILV